MLKRRNVETVDGAGEENGVGERGDEELLFFFAVDYVGLRISREREKVKR